MRLDVLALAISGVGFLAFGLAMLIAPQAVMASVDIVIPAGVATTEARAFYGGLELGLAALLLAAAWQPQYRRAGLWLGLASYGGIALARALGMSIDGTGGGFLIGALIVESTLAALCAAALKMRH